MHDHSMGQTLKSLIYLIAVEDSDPWTPGYQDTGLIHRLPANLEMSLPLLAPSIHSRGSQMVQKDDLEGGKATTIE